jgi:hypothetical protein
MGKLKTFVNFKKINENTESWNYDIDHKLNLLRGYIHLLKSSDSYMDNVYLVDDSEVKEGAYNIDSAIHYFIIIHNFLIIERGFYPEVKECNKEINKYLDIKPLNSVEGVLELFHELYDPHHKVRFAIETFDSIESVRKFISDRPNVYNTLIKK